MSRSELGYRKVGCGLVVASAILLAGCGSGSTATEHDSRGTTTSTEAAAASAAQKQGEDARTYIAGIQPTLAKTASLINRIAAGVDTVSTYSGLSGMAEIATICGKVATWGPDQLNAYKSVQVPSGLPDFDAMYIDALRDATEVCIALADYVNNDDAAAAGEIPRHIKDASDEFGQTTQQLYGIAGQQIPSALVLQ